ncbi:MAG: serine hydrolase domain-containing protein [Candidatus Kariarchaeaceae archaeon]|jgi:CubicO group peptidase (beta-lactamase class C family)
MDYETLFSSKMDALLAEEMNLTNTPGTCLAIVEDNELTFTRSYGAMDFERSTPTNVDTLFCVASVTKSFICAGVMKLQEEGKLNVSDPISNYLPITVGFPDNPIQIHHLMSHQSGIPDLADAMWGRNRESFFMIGATVPKYPFTSWDDGFRYLNGAQEFISMPGERFHYNNFGYGILSKLITEVSGEDFKSYLRRHIFDPLEMQRTGFFNEIKDDTNLSKGYMDKPGSDVNEFIHVPYEDIRLTRSLDEAAGGLFSSVEELTHYLIMHLNNGEFKGKRVLSKESTDAMQKRQFKEEFPNAAFSGFYGQTVSGYGYGFAIDENFHGQKLVQHSGSFIGASAWFSFLPEQARGVVMLSNHHPSPRIFSQAILTESLGKDCTTEWPLLRLRAYQNRLTGIYHSYKGMSKLKVTTAGGQLFISSLDDKGRTGLLPWNGDPSTMDYYVPSEMGGRDPVQFVDKGDDIFLHRERKLWKKVGELASNL